MDKTFTFGDLASFEKLVAPKLLKIVYWAGLAGMTLFALISFFGALRMLDYSAAAGLGTMLLTVLVYGFAVLFWRVMIEIYMVFFGIYDRLGEIRATLDKRP